MDGLFICTAERFIARERPAQLLVIAGEDDGIVDRGAHEDALHDEQREIIHVVALPAHGGDGHIDAALHEQHEDERNGGRAECQQDDEEDGDGGDEAHGEKLTAEVVRHLVHHGGGADEVGLPREIIFAACVEIVHEGGRLLGVVGIVGIDDDAGPLGAAHLIALGVERLAHLGADALCSAAEGIGEAVVERERVHEFRERHGHIAAPALGVKDVFDDVLRHGAAAHLRHRLGDLREIQRLIEGVGIGLHGADVLVLLQIRDQGQDGALVLILIDQHDGVVRREDGREIVREILGEDDGREAAQIKKQREHGDKDKRDHVPRLLAEEGEPARRQRDGLLRRLFHETIAPEDQRGQNGEDADHADEHALGEDDAELASDLERHEHEREQTHDRGEGAGEDGGERVLEGGLHGVRFRKAQLLLLAVAVHEDDGIVHAEHQLQHRRDGKRDIGDIARDEIRAEVDDDGHADGDEKQHRLDPRPAHEHEDRNENAHADGEELERHFGFHHLVRADGKVVVLKLLGENALHRPGLTGIVAIVEVHDEERAAVLVVMRVPGDVFHAGDIDVVGDLLADRGNLALVQPGEDEAEGALLAGIRKRGLDDLDASAHGRICREIARHVRVDLDAKSEKGAENRHGEHHRRENVSPVHQNSGKLFHATASIQYYNWFILPRSRYRRNKKIPPERWEESFL